MIINNLNVFSIRVKCHSEARFLVHFCIFTYYSANRSCVEQRVLDLVILHLILCNVVNKHFHYLLDYLSTEVDGVRHDVIARFKFFSQLMLWIKSC